jgi:hypothetical protein
MRAIWRTYPAPVTRTICFDKLGTHGFGMRGSHGLRSSAHSVKEAGPTCSHSAKPRWRDVGKVHRSARGAPEGCLVCKLLARRVEFPSSTAISAPVHA